MNICPLDDLEKPEKKKKKKKRFQGEREREKAKGTNVCLHIAFALFCEKSASKENGFAGVSNVGGGSHLFPSHP